MSVFGRWIASIQDDASCAYIDKKDQAELCEGRMHHSLDGSTVGTLRRVLTQSDRIELRIFTIAVSMPVHALA